MDVTFAPSRTTNRVSYIADALDARGGERWQEIAWDDHNDDYRCFDTFSVRNYVAQTVRELFDKHTDTVAAFGADVKDGPVIFDENVFSKCV